MSTEALRTTIRGLMPQAKADLAQMVSLKSVHDAKQFPPAECQRMVDFLIEAFTELGLQDVQGYQTPDGSQAVVGHRPGPPGSKTVLLYFHHDVQPPTGRCFLGDAGLGAHRTQRSLVRARRRRLQGQHRHAPDRIARSR